MKMKDIGRKVVDPLDIGLGESIFGRDGGKFSTEEEQAAMQDALAKYQGNIDAFQAGGAPVYQKGENLNLQQVGNLDQLGPSAMDGITTDSRYHDAELAALADLENQSKTGFTARDQADLAKLEGDVNRQNRGRLGAIQQGMQARGMGGSGLDIMAQVQASQDATEREALASLEKNAQMNERKSDATSRLGSLSSQLQSRDFAQQAAKAQAADAINRFNTANSVNRTLQNTDIANRQAGANWDRSNSTADRNTAGAYDFRKDSLSAGQQGAQMAYNASADAYNRKMLEEQQRKAAQKARGAAVGTLAGGAAGAVMGGPAGASAGASMGGAAGGMISDEDAKDNIRNQSEMEIEHFLDSISPKAYTYKGDSKEKHGVVAQDLERSKIGAGMVETRPEDGLKQININDAVASLLQAVSYLNDKVKKGGK